MSVGGRVAYTRDLGPVVQIATWEQSYPTDDYTAIDVEKHPIWKLIEPGDTVWWQGRQAFWTPRAGDYEEVIFTRVGYSYTVPAK